MSFERTAILAISSLIAVMTVCETITESQKERTKQLQIQLEIERTKATNTK